jgi:hypothetical protein
MLIVTLQGKLVDGSSQGGRKRKHLPGMFFFLVKNESERFEGNNIATYFLRNFGLCPNYTVLQLKKIVLFIIIILMSWKTYKESLQMYAIFDFESLSYFHVQGSVILFTDLFIIILF